MGVYTDDDLDDLIKENIRLTKENNKLLKKMRRAQVWAGVLKFLMFAIAIGVPLFMYFYFLKPVIDDLQATYQEMADQAEAMGERIPELPEWAQGFFGEDEDEATVESADSVEEA